MDGKEIKPNEEEFDELQEEIEDQNPQEEQKINEGAWSTEQNMKYVFFMTYFKDVFVSKERRKSFKIFKFLANYLETRNPRQCRSHFQKLINKHKTIHKLKTHFRGLIGKQKYDESYKEFSNMMDSNHHLNKLKNKEEEGEKYLKEMGVQTDGSLQSNIPPKNIGSASSIQEMQNQPVNGLYGFWIFPSIQHQNEKNH